MGVDPRLAESVNRMTDAAVAFLASLSKDQRSLAEIGFLDEGKRKSWYYTPVERHGLTFTQMDGFQRDLAHGLLGTGLSGTGVHQARTIMFLESILAEIEGPQAKWIRDPERYYITVFGIPGSTEPWGWRFEGHHISINYTIVNGDLIGPTPIFFGSNPATVLHGDHQGVRALADEEEAARDLLASLDTDQKKLAIVSEVAPVDILTRNVPTVTDELTDEPGGIDGGRMTESQRANMRQLIEVYLARFPENVANHEFKKVSVVDDSSIHFAWSGPEARGEGHYYRVLGPTFLAEYDCTQNDANHVHAVWRDLTNDFGADILRHHYTDSHR